MKVRLLAPIHHQGRLHEAGEIIDVPDDWKIPKRARRKSPDKIDYTTDPAIDAQHLPGEFEDVPLAEEVKPEMPSFADDQRPIEPGEEHGKSPSGMADAC